MQPEGGGRVRGAIGELEEVDTWLVTSWIEPPILTKMAAVSGFEEK